MDPQTVDYSHGGVLLSSQQEPNASTSCNMVRLKIMFGVLIQLFWPRHFLAVACETFQLRHANSELGCGI